MNALMHSLTGDRPHHSLYWWAQWCVILIPAACAVSRFAADLLLVLTVLIFLTYSILARDWEWLRHRWVQIALAVWLYLVILSFWAENPDKAVGRSLAWLRFPVFAAALMHWILADATARYRLMMGLSAAVGFMIIDTAIQYFAGIELLGREPIPAEGSPRLTGPFSAPRIGIMLVWMAIPAASYWLMAQGGGLRHGRSFWIGIAYAIGFLTVVFMSGERMALLLSGLGFVVAFFLLPISKKIMLGIGIAGMLAMGALAYFNEGLIVRHFHSTSTVVGEFQGSDYGMIWQSAINIVEDYPITGVGLRQFRELCPDPAYGPTHNLKQRCNQHPHNMYLEWLVEAGIIGLGAYLAMIVLWSRSVIRHFSTLRTHPIFMGLLITLFIRLWPLASNTSFFTAWSAVPFWLFVGWMLAYIRLADEGKDVT